MDGSMFKESDLFSFAGLALLVPAIVGGIKKLWPKWIDGKEPTVALVITYVLGFTAKLTSKGVAFPGVSWVGLAVGLLFVAMAATQVHDTMLNKIIHRNDDGAPPPGGADGGPK